MSLNILLVAFGTAGDVHPFVGIGTALRARGHRVTLITNGLFESLAARFQLPFCPTGTAEEFQREMNNPALWNSLSGAMILGRNICEVMPAQYEAIVDRYEPGRTVVVASGAAFGARIAHETLGVPLASIVLQPCILRSVHQAPVVAGFPPILNLLPRIAKAALYRLFDVCGDRIFHAKRVNAFRAGLGLAPVSRLMNEWWLSPQRIIALFPDWFGCPQRDWPEQIRLTGFPMFDERLESEGLPDDVESFLSAGDPPIIFTPGSGMMFGQAFFETATQACLKLGRRGILLSRFAHHIPSDLPPCVRYFPYVPFSQVLPRAAALVHHGGVGTLAQAMAAGIPQLIRPMAYDQPDNAVRAKRLGIADWLRPRSFRTSTVVARLHHLLTSPQVAQCCRDVAGRLTGNDALNTTCDLIEQLAENPDRGSS